MGSMSVIDKSELVKPSSSQGKSKRINNQTQKRPSYKPSQPIMKRTRQDAWIPPPQPLMLRFKFEPHIVDVPFINRPWCRQPVFTVRSHCCCCCCWRDWCCCCCCSSFVSGLVRIQLKTKLISATLYIYTTVWRHTYTRPTTDSALTVAWRSIIMAWDCFPPQVVFSSVVL